MLTSIETHTTCDFPGGGGGPGPYPTPSGSAHGLIYCQTRRVRNEMYITFDGVAPPTH